MPRPKQCRRVECPPESKGFRPLGRGCLRRTDPVVLKIDEYESIRLIDYEGLSQDEAALRMQVSRPTCTRIYESARKAIALAIVECRELQIGEGDVEFYGEWHSNTNNQKRKNMKKIAIPTTDGMLFQHFGKASQFTFVTIEDGKIINKEAIDAPPHAHGVAPRFVISHEATEVLAGGMGATPLEMLTEAGIEVHIGAPSLPIDGLVSKYLDGSLTYNETNVCNHNHGEEGHHHDSDSNNDKNNCGEQIRVFKLPKKN